MDVRALDECDVPAASLRAPMVAVPRSEVDRDAMFLADFGFCRAEFWTGHEPVPARCPGVGPDGVIRSLPLLDTAKCSRADVLAYFDNTWALTEVLFSALRGESAFLVLPPHRLRHPLIFYYAHVAVFYVNKMRVAGLLDAPIDSSLEMTFETGVDEMRWDDRVGEHSDWPSLARVRAYRRIVYECVRRVIATHRDLAPGHARIDEKSSLWAILMGFEHERIHLETSSVLMRELPLHLLVTPPEWPRLDTTSSRWNQRSIGQMVAVAERRVVLGKPDSVSSFGWDNEYGRREVRVHAFRAGATLVTNGEFLGFVRAGGYLDSAHWDAAGWAWRQGTNAKWPTFWVPRGPAGLHEYGIRTCFEEVDWRDDWPAEVNQHEARAYCAWLTRCRGATRPYRLLVEAEHAALRPLGDDDPVMACRGPGGSGAELANVNLATGGPRSVTAGSPSEQGFYDVFGNVWQRCEDDFAPLTGFRAHPYYEDFSVPCFDGEHNVIMGGSFVSTGDEASRYARFHFRPHFFQHAGFRVAQDEDQGVRNEPERVAQLSCARDDKYESSACLAAYLQLHFGDDVDSMPFSDGPISAVGFPRRVAKLARDVLEGVGHPLGRALDLGCAVGGTSFALARYFDRVDGVDRSVQFIDVAKRLASGERVSFELVDDGVRTVPREVGVAVEGFKGRARFALGDACQIDSWCTGYDLVVLANLLCRLPDPAACLRQFVDDDALVNAGGVILITAPYSWNERFAPRERWLSDGSGFAAIAGILGAKYELLERRDMPLVIREHRRKYEYVVADSTVWRKRV